MAKSVSMSVCPECHGMAEEGTSKGHRIACSRGNRPIEASIDAEQDECQRCGKIGGKVVSFNLGSIGSSRWVCPHCMDDAAAPSLSEVAEKVEKLPRLGLTCEDEIWLVQEWPSGRYLNRNDVLDILNAALQSVVTPSGWRDIETAPKDGTHILFARESPWSSSSNVCVGFWADESITDFPQWRTDNGFMLDERVYRLWMPLPSLPATKEK